MVLALYAALVPDMPTTELVGLLRSPDPRQRDEFAYAQLAERITSGHEDGGLLLLGDQLVECFHDERVQARSFGALVLGEVVARDAVTGELDPADLRTWLAALSAWYLSEEDLRGFDVELGWLHAVAHGADAIGAFALNRHIGRDDLVGLLDHSRDRILSSGTELFANHEDDRVALAMALVLARSELSKDERVDWLRPIDVALAAGEPGPVPAWVSNTLHTLRALYVLADRGGHVPGDPSAPFLIPEPRAVTEAIAATVRRVFPFIG